MNDKCTCCGCGFRDDEEKVFNNKKKVYHKNCIDFHPIAKHHAECIARVLRPDLFKK